ncbi:MAG: 3-hydroxyacyl-CoA dehydrogenase NAD-binding domain-containing protein [Pikeienuella sp.]
MKTAAIVGAGLIGRAWALVFARAGWRVMAWDPSAEVRADLPPALKAEADSLAAHGLLADPAAALGRVNVAETLAAALEDADFVQENGPEQAEIKRALFGEMDALAPAGAIIASSTSAITPSQFTEGLAGRARCLVGHPVNPPHLMPLVELFGPDRDRIADAVEFYRGFGRHPVTLKREAVGHIANRLSSALWREAVNIVAEDIADVAAVDEALVYGPGLRWSVMGAHMSYHLGGGQGGIAHYLDHLGPSQERRWQDLGSPSLDDETCAALVAGIAQEAGGRDITTLEKARDTALIAIQRVLNEKRP